MVATQDSHLLGPIYGYVTRPGQWWHDRVTPALDSDLVERWFRDSFVLVEFAVRPDSQGQGVGWRLHEAVLTDLPQPTAVTITHQQDNPAVSFYGNRG